MFETKEKREIKKPKNYYFSVVYHNLEWLFFKNSLTCTGVRNVHLSVRHFAVGQFKNVFVADRENIVVKERQEGEMKNLKREERRESERRPKLCGVYSRLYFLLFQIYKSSKSQLQLSFSSHFLFSLQMHFFYSKLVLGLRILLLNDFLTNNSKKYNLKQWQQKAEKVKHSPGVCWAFLLDFLSLSFFLLLSLSSIND